MGNVIWIDPRGRRRGGVTWKGLRDPDDPIYDKTSVVLQPCGRQTRWHIKNPVPIAMRQPPVPLPPHRIVPDEEDE
jgi:hypothetical protein